MATKKHASRLLAEWRAAEGISQCTAAARFRVSQPAVSEWESRKKTPRTIEQVLIIEAETDGAVPVESWRAERRRPRKASPR